jgi:bcr-type benzoyl-CoA reductase subunit C
MKEAIYMSKRSVGDLMQPFRDVVDRPYERLRQWKESNDMNVVGCSPMHFPEELIHAAGMLPVVLQESDEPITDGFSYVHPFFCGITRNIIDIASKGELSFFDALIYSDICIQNRNAVCTLKQVLPDMRVEFLQLPTCLNREGVMDRTVKELEQMRLRLENMAGRKIDDASLEESIGVFNRNRFLLRKLHDLYMANPTLISFREKQLAVQSSMLMPKEEHTTLLEDLLGAFENVSSSPAEGKRLFLSGHLCQGPKADILELIEGMGGVFTDDDLYTGYRYYALDAPINGNPIESLAKRYLDSSLPIPTRSDPTIRWEDFVVDKARDSGAQGVVVLVAKYCEPHLFIYPFIKEALDKAGIPHIMLETEHEVVSLEGMRTRLQAFIEMLG